MPEREQQRLLRAALEREAEAQRLLIGGEPNAPAAFREVADLYRRSWEAAHERAFGRLVGFLKAAVLAGEGEAEAAYVRDQLGGGFDSPTSAYALALAALTAGDDEGARDAADAMRGDSPGFGRAAAAIEALADRDRAAYARSLESIVTDFEARSEHLTGVAIADTALVLERLAARRGLAAGLSSALLPAARPR